MGNNGERFKATRELSRSAEYMFQQNPDNIKYLDRWEKKFGFEGNLNVKECTKVVKEEKKEQHSSMSTSWECFVCWL